MYFILTFNVKHHRIKLTTLPLDCSFFLFCSIAISWIIFSYEEMKNGLSLLYRIKLRFRNTLFSYFASCILCLYKSIKKSVSSKVSTLVFVFLGVGLFTMTYFLIRQLLKNLFFLVNSDLNSLHVHFPVERSPFLFFLGVRKLNDLSSEG